MLNKKQLENLVSFWKKGVKENYKTMNSLYSSKRYSACLFFGHLVLEKTLKVIIVQKNRSHPPKIHNLRRLIDLTKIEFDEKDMDSLSEINTFNMESRYPEEKYDFYKICNKKFTDKYMLIIKKIYKKLCQEMK